MNRYFSRFFFLVAAACLVFAAQTRAIAGGLAPADEAGVRAVVQAQFEAFAEDNADAAFDLAAPEMQQSVGSSGRFLAMVRGVYPMVYRPASVAYMKPETRDGSVIQLVQITDSNERSWLAIYSLEQQADASWRISGCIVMENKGRAA
ncbi:MAG: DUF4864 domain-containing protein [Burkholderiaceae bacterium]